MKTFESIYNYLIIIVKAIAKFLNYAYASEITIAAIGVWVNLFQNKVIGSLLIGWAVMLFIINFQYKK